MSEGYSRCEQLTLPMPDVEALDVHRNGPPQVVDALHDDVTALDDRIAAVAPSPVALTLVEVAEPSRTSTRVSIVAIVRPSFR